MILDLLLIIILSVLILLDVNISICFELDFAYLIPYENHDILVSNDFTVLLQRIQERYY